MKSKVIYIISLIVTSWLLQFGQIWWLFVLPALLWSWIFSFDRKYLYFFAAFISIFFLWTSQAFWIDVQNTHILSQRVGTLFGGIGGYGIMVVTGLFGGAIGGLSALLGAQLRSMVTKASQDDPPGEEYLDLEDIKNLSPEDRDKDFV